MNVYDEYLDEKFSFNLEKVLMIYRSNYETLCTLNKVEKKNDSFEIMQGIPINGKMLADVFSELKENGKNKNTFEWQNPRILAKGSGQLLWYSPAVSREIFFSCKNKKLMKISGKKFPFPPLLFYARKRTLHVFVLKTSRRPTMETKLWQAPFWNISESGKVCLPLNAREKMYSVEEWENLFFNSAFSHPGGAGFKEGTVETIFPGIVKTAGNFPLNLLKESKIQIKSILERGLK